MPINTDKYNRSEIQRERGCQEYGMYYVRSNNGVCGCVMSGV